MSGNNDSIDVPISILMNMKEDIGTLTNKIENIETKVDTIDKKLEVFTEKIIPKFEEKVNNVEDKVEKSLIIFDSKLNSYEKENKILIDKQNVDRDRAEVLSGEKRAKVQFFQLIAYLFINVGASVSTVLIVLHFLGGI